MVWHEYMHICGVLCLSLRLDCVIVLLMPPGIFQHEILIISKGKIAQCLHFIFGAN